VQRPASRWLHNSTKVMLLLSSRYQSNQPHSGEIMVEIEITPTLTKAASRRHYFFNLHIKIFYILQK